jgi:hypothetical protein
MDQITAFDLICSKIETGDPITGTLVACACDKTVHGYLALERWLVSKRYECVTTKGSLFYKCEKRSLRPRKGVFA